MDERVNRGDDAAALGELLGAEDTALARIEDTVMLERLLQQLPQREREILRLRFEEALTQREIGALVGVSQMHVSRLLHQSLERLRAIADTERTGST